MCLDVKMLMAHMKGKMNMCVKIDMCAMNILMKGSCHTYNFGYFG